MKSKQDVLGVHIHLPKCESPTFIDSIDLFGDTKEIHIEYASDKYILKINDQNELELLLDENKLH